MVAGKTEAWGSSLSPSSSEPWRWEGGGRFEIGLEAGAGVRREKEQRTLEQQEGERLCTTASPPSRAQNKGAWGNSAAHVQSTATRCPRPQAVRARGASPLPFHLSTRPSPCAPWARGLLSAFWERGSPDLPAYGLRHGSNGGPAWPIFINTRLKTLARGQASRGGRHDASSSTVSSGWLARRRRDQGGVPHEVPMTQAMTTKGARRAPARAASPFPLWCKGSKRRREDQAKAPISVQQDQDQSNGGKEVTMEPRTASP